MSDDQFNKLFKYMQHRFADVDRRFSAIETRFDSLIDLLDASMKRTEIYDHERLVLGHQVDRHDRWIHELGDGTGVGLSPP